MVFLSQGKQLLIVHRQDNSVHVWDLTTGQETKSWTAGAVSFAAAMSRDERWCLVLGWIGGSLLRDLATGDETYLDISEPFDAVFSPDGNVFAAASGIGFVKLWETATRREMATLRGFLLGVHSVAFSPDGKRLAAGSAGQEAIKLWDMESQQELLSLEGQGSVFYSSAFSPDGNVLGSMNLYNRMLHLWRAPSWAEIDAAEKMQ
jgi:WD40 repeat protein